MGTAKGWDKDTGSNLCGTNCSRKSDNATRSYLANGSMFERRGGDVLWMLQLTDEMYDGMLGNLKEEGRAAKAFSKSVA
ncbi:hypothetical protein VKT23_010650 [Stygiomarasmius scandens]|uniref:Uncharacterized protein n=1 Tax=Marasmiellus scandens TaxID=2682957 RepID=A0ABR1JDL4_9AGAR